MNGEDKVILDVTGLAGSECKIHTIAGHILGHVKFITSTVEMVGTKQPLIPMIKQIVKDIKQHKPEELYSKMNSGSDEDLLRWQQFSYMCLLGVVYQHVLHDTPIPAYKDDDVLPQSKRTSRER
jgi:hypothetical protein